MLKHALFYSFFISIFFSSDLHAAMKEFQQTQNDFAALRKQYLNKNTTEADKKSLIPVQGKQATLEELNRLRAKINKAFQKARFNAEDIKDVRINIALLETGNSSRWPGAQDYRELLEAKLKKQELIGKSPRRIIVRAPHLSMEEIEKTQSPLNNGQSAQQKSLEVEKKPSLLWTSEHEKVAALFKTHETITRDNLRQCTLWIEKAQLNGRAKNADQKTLEQLARECDELYRTAHDGMSASETLEEEWAAFMKALQK